MQTLASGASAGTGNAATPIAKSAPVVRWAHSAAAVATAALASVWPFGQERVLTLFDSAVTIR